MKKQFTCTLCFLCAYLLLPGNISADEIQKRQFPDDFASRKWTASEGLPGNCITDILQDSKGYIYIGTYNHFVRFDGIKFTEPWNESFSSRVIFEDSKGILWVGSNDEGLVRIENNALSFYTLKNGLPNNSVRDIAEDADGNIWVGTAAGVLYITPENTLSFPPVSGTDPAAIRTVFLYRDSDGSIWLGTSEPGGLYSFTGGAFTKYRLPEPYAHTEITAMIRDPSGTVWLGTAQKGIARYKNGSLMPWNHIPELQGTGINDIYCDTAGTLWFGTEKGVVRLQDGVFSCYCERQGLANNNVKRIIEDREGNIWLATDRGGIERLSTGKFLTRKTAGAVNCIAENRRGLIWLGTDSGLLCYDTSGRVENSVTQACRGTRIRHISFAANGEMLISTYDGLLRTDGTRIRKWTEKDGLAGNKVRAALGASDGSVYAGTLTGLSIITGDGSITNTDKADGLENSYIMCIHEDSRKRIWIGTDGGGLFLFENGRITRRFTSENGLAGNVIFSISEDAAGSLWICTGMGISRYDGASFFNYVKANGLETNSVFQIMTDSCNTVWMISDMGITSVPRSDMDAVLLGAKEKIHLNFFGHNDGLQTGGITSIATGLCDSRGRLWFPLIDGFAVYDPAKTKSNSTVPLVYIENIKTDGRRITECTDTISLPPGTKRISINYTGLSFISPEMIRFKYKLEGFDSSYSELTSSRSASFTNLPPGFYTFHVMAANTDGIWSRQAAAVSFVQQPYFFQRPSCWILLSASLCVLVLSVIGLRYRQMVHIRKKLETMVQIKTMDLENERDTSNRLLLNILPAPIAERLKLFENVVIADYFDEASVLFADIVGFTEITAKSSAEEIVRALNDLFCRFDKRAQETGIEKIKTIGDSYMAVCGLPEQNTGHAAAMLRFAVGLYEDLAEYNKSAHLPFNLRIGINSGGVIAGVIGKSKFIYDLWGDTVNIASRMQSLCTPGAILVTEAVKTRAGDSFPFTDPRNCHVKGIGMMKTYTLLPDAGETGALQ